MTPDSTTLWCEHAFVDGRVRAGVLIDIVKGRFATIVSDSDPETATQLWGFTIPGLSNSHSHAFHRALRSRTQADKGTFWTWRELMYRAADRLEPENYYRLARATFAEMALAGVTCVGEFHYVHHQPGGAPYNHTNEMGAAMFAAAEAAGIRITLLDTLYLHGGLEEAGYSPVVGTQHRFSDRTVDDWIERVDALEVTHQQRIGAAIHSVRAVAPAAMSILGEWAANTGAPIHAHVSEQVTENRSCHNFHGSTPIGVIADAGLLNERFSAVHATHVDAADITALAHSAATVVMCPTTERDLGDGIGPTSQFASSDIPMALGSDSHAVIDLFEESRSLELHARLDSQSRGIHTAADLLAMASVNGHRSLGWPDAGSIAVGNRADLVTVRLDSVRTAGTPNKLAVEAAIFAASAADVSCVYVDGRLVVSGGRHGTIDVANDLYASINELMGHD